MVGLKLFVEGGGDGKLLQTACRRGFSGFLGKAGLKGRMPRIIACGSRADAFDSFRTAIGTGQAAMLLVDSEGPVASQSPWVHLAERTGDKWIKPDNAEDRHCHLMVQCMEAWFVADRVTLIAYFGQGFRAGSLPSPDRKVEQIERPELNRSLATATKSAKTKGEYHKGRHSFEILERLDPKVIVDASPWAARFIDTLSQEMGP